MHLSLLTLSSIPPDYRDLQRRNMCRGILVTVTKETYISWYILFI
jgi:hypothetical protein